jgi:hypothetical protein
VIRPIDGTTAGHSCWICGPERAAPMNAEAIARALRSIGRSKRIVRRTIERMLVG